jgi:hypothetical protein
MMRRPFRVLSVTVFVLTSTVASAQAPYNLFAPVKNLATLFTGLYGPNGLIVDSEATLPGEQSHSAHFNNDFQADFGKFGTALVSNSSRYRFRRLRRVSRTVWIPAPASSSARRRVSGRSSSSAPRRLAHATCHLASRRSDLRLTRWRE